MPSVLSGMLSQLLFLCIINFLWSIFVPLPAITKSLWTLSTVAHRSPMLLAGSISGRPHSKWWWCHNIGYPLLAAKHSLCKASWSVTHCRSTCAHSRTMSSLDSAWKLGFSLATNLNSALETSWQLRYIKSHLPLPLPWYLANHSCEFHQICNFDAVGNKDGRIRF